MRYLNSALLVIDEVGFRPLAPDRGEPLLPARVGPLRTRRIIVTTAEHVRDWPDVFAGDEILTTAILDRLLHHVHIDGRSYRFRELDQLLTAPTPAPPDAPTHGGPQPRQRSAVRTSG